MNYSLSAWVELLRARANPYADDTLCTLSAGVLRALANDLDEVLHKDRQARDAKVPVK